MLVSRLRTTTASTCSSPSAQPATRAPMARRSESLAPPTPVVQATNRAQHGWMPERCVGSRGGAADGELGDPEGGHAVADGHTLAVLAAHPRRAHGEVVADG